MVFGRHINKYYFKYLFFIIIGLVSTIAVDLYQLEIPEVYGAIINGIEKQTLTKIILNDLIKKMFLIMAIMVCGRFLWRVCFFGSSVKMEADLRLEMFDHLKDMSQGYFSENKVGNLMSLFTNDLDTIQECFGWGILMAIDVFGLGSFSIYKMWKLNPILTLFALIPMAIMVAVGIIVGKYMSKKWEARQEAFSNLSDYTQESFSGLAVIKAFVKETKELLHFKKINKENEIANVEFVKASTLLNILITVLIQSVVCIIWGYGGYLVFKGNHTVAELVMFSSYFSTLIWPMSAISELISMTSRGKTSLKRVSETLDAKADIVDSKDATILENPLGNIRFDNLTFRYPGASYNSLNNISFEIKAGENVGIIGKTGCGKTTLVDILLRIYNIDDDKVFIDGNDINHLTIKSLRDAIAYVPQDNFLFSDTIQNNISFAFENASEEDVKKYAAMACVINDIEGFPDKYKTILGERGVTISGGQKQRTSIARALMKEASILILDDSVSAVDTKTEASILSSLALSRKGRTTIFIAHRISTVKNMDKIIFMGDGKIEAIGTHEYLEANCKEYANMVALQKLEEEQGGNA